MSEHQNERRDLVLSPSVFFMLIGAAFAGGGGTGTVFAPQLEEEAVQACLDDSSEVLKIATNNHNGLTQLGGEVDRLREYVNEKTLDPYTSTDALRDSIEKEQRDRLQDQRLDWLEGQY